MRKVRRFDRSGIEGVIITPQGFLRAPAKATRVGVLKYKKPDGSIVRELRHPEEVFSKDSLATLAGVPVTDDHPEAMLLNPENAHEYMCGYTSDIVEQDGDFVKTSATITDADLIEKVKGGKVELSCGYECEHDESPGVWNGQPYDVIQRKIQYNHLAVVDRGRAGPEARLRLDADDAILDEQPEDNTMMVKIKIGDMEFEVPEAVANELKAMADKNAGMAAEMDKMKADMAKAPEMEKQVADMKAEAEKAEAKMDSLKAELEKAKAAPAPTVKLDADEVKKATKERIKLIAVAAQRLPAEKLQKLDDMSDLEIKKEVILADSPKAELEGKSEIYLAARFDSIAETMDNVSGILAITGKTISENRDSGVKNDSEEARKRSREKSQNLWQEPLSVNK